MADAIPGAAPVSAATPVTNTPATSVDASGDTGIDAGEVDATDVAAAPKKDVKPVSSKKKYQLKVDGRDEDFEFDPTNDEDVKKHLQLSKVSHKRMQESAEIRKSVQELLDTLRTDPLKVIGDPRLNIPEETRKKMAQAIIDNELEEMAKTPEQKEKEKTQREYERLKKELEDTKKAREDADMARLTAQEAATLDNEMSAAIEKSGLPKNARTVKYMAEAMMFCLQNGLDLNAQDLVPYIKKQTLSEFKEMISSLPDEEFENWLGKDQIGRLRKRNIAKGKIENPSGIKPTGAESQKQAEPVKKIPFKDFMRGLGK